jgi:hypothetical protein
VHAQLARAKAHATVSDRRCHECPRKTRSRYSASFRVFPRPKKRHTHDSFSVCSLVSDGFRLKTPLSNTCEPNLPGLKPRLRFLDRANRGHVIPRHSAFFCGQKKTHPRFLFRVFRVFLGERWFPFENTVIEPVHAQVARAKAHATVSDPRCHECPRKTRSRHSASFRVFPRPKKRHTHDSFSVCSLVSDGFRLKTPLSNTCMRKLPGLKPRLRFLDRGATNARAKRGHVILRHSAFFRGQKNATPTIPFPCAPW